MRRRTISVFLSLMLCLSLLSACGTTTDVPINGSNRDIAFEETQQEESAEGSDSTTSENGESASDPESGKDDSVSDKAQPSQPEQNANENSLSAEAPAFSLSSIAEYTDKPYVAVNGNVPYFTESELTDQSYEYYSDLDALGRCGTACASIGQDLMPTESRGSIGMVKPSGWHTVRYDDLVDGKYLYNRCHLIGFQLTGENANTKNLITGTRYLNIEGMLPFENMVADYVKENGNHVMYRVTPIFEGDNLLANGVLMEGYSVEDKGAGVSYCVFAYNVQPGIEIDYSTSIRSGERMKKRSGCVKNEKDLSSEDQSILVQHRMLLGLWSQPVLRKRSWMRNISGSARAMTRPLKNGQWIATIGDGSCVRFAAELSRMRRCPITVAREVQTRESVPIVHEMVVANPHSWLDIIRMMVYY